MNGRRSLPGKSPKVGFVLCFPIDLRYYGLRIQAVWTLKYVRVLVFIAFCFVLPTAGGALRGQGLISGSRQSTPKYELPCCFAVFFQRLGFHRGAPRGNSLTSSFQDLLPRGPNHCILHYIIDAIRLEMEPSNG